MFDAKLYPKYTSAKEKRKDDAGTGIKNVGVALNTIKEGLIGLVDVKNTIGSFIYLLKDPAGALKGILGKTRSEYEKNGATSFLTTLAIAYASKKAAQKVKIPYKNRIKFGKNCKNHLMNPERFSKTGISGGHNQKNFYKYLKDIGIDPDEIIV